MIPQKMATLDLKKIVLREWTKFIVHKDLENVLKNEK